MKQSDLMLTNEVFPGCEVVLSFSFKTMKTWDKCALFAMENQRFIMSSDFARGQSAHFRNSDCFECQTPHTIAA